MILEKAKANRHEPAWKEPLMQLTDMLEKYEEFILRDRFRKELIQKIDREIQQATFSANKVYKTILEEGLNEIKADYGHIYQIDGDRLRLLANKGSHKVDEVMSIKSSLCGRALLNNEIINIGDVSQLALGEYHQLHEDTKSELAMPIRDYRGVKDLGVFNIERKTRGVFDRESVQFCELLRGQIAIAMEQVKIWEGVSLVHDLSRELLLSKTDLAANYNIVLEKILKLLHFELGQILLLIRDKLIIVASSNPEDVGLSVGAEDSVCGAYIITENGREPLIIDDIKESKYAKHYKWLLGRDEKKRMVSEFVVPLLSGNHVVGVINIEDPRREAFSEFDTRILNILGNMIAGAIESATRWRAIQDFENAKGADLVLTQLGHLSIGFLHNFGGRIGNAKARLAEFSRSVSDVQLPDFGEKPGIQFLEGILQNLREAESHIENLRAKFDPKMIDITLKPVDLIKVTKDAVQRVQITKPETISILNQIDPSLIERSSIECLLTDQFGEILDSLLINAIEAMPNGGKIEILIRQKDPTTAEVSIKDTGEGMSEEAQERIFDFGFTTKRKGRPGQGLGMWFVRMYVHRFAGKIYFESTLGKGTTFYLSLPISFRKEALLNLSTATKQRREI